MIASACGGGGRDVGGAAAQTQAPPPSATRNQINAMPRDKVQDGGKFTWPLDGMPPNFNYNQLDGTQHDNAYVVWALLPTTYTSDAAGAPIWNPDYLASEPTLTLDPKQVVTFRINPKAVWYDGTPITWEDFFWQWKASNGTNKAYIISSASGYEDIESVQKGKDDREVIVTFKHRYADWQGVFYLFCPASTNKDPKIFNEGWKYRPLTTAGPFKLDSIDNTSKTITLVRNEKWWGDRAKLDTVVFRVIEPDAQIDALANGEIDAMDVGPDASKYTRAKRIATTEARIAGGPNFRHITINGTSPNLQDVKVRQAVAMAIDRAAIARALLGPLGVQAQPLGNHIFMANQDGYQDNSGEVGQYNPEKARQMLDAAGRPQERRQTSGDHLRDSFRGGHIQAGIRADPEHARPGWREDGYQRCPIKRLVRQVPHSRPVSRDGIFLDRNPISDRLIEIALRQAHAQRQRGNGHPAEFCPYRFGRNRPALRSSHTGARSKEGDYPG